MLRAFGNNAGAILVDGTAAIAELVGIGTLCVRWSRRSKEHWQDKEGEEVVCLKRSVQMV